MKNYGFIAPKLDSTQYVFGGGDVPLEVYNAQRDWRSFVPSYEPQYNAHFDSYGCTVWGTLNAIEMLLKSKTGKDYNFSERFIYILANIVPPGADPHHVAEMIRAHGLIENDVLPFGENMSFEEFKQPNPMTDVLKKLGRQWKDDNSFKHEWVPTSTAALVEALKYSPLGISVTAWFEKDGVYVDNGMTNNHWCVLTYIEKVNGIYFPHILDSYNQTHKVLDPDHNIQFAKRYYIAPDQISFWTKVMEILKGLIGLTEKVIEEQKKPVPIVNKKDDLVKKVIGYIGRDASPGDKVSDEVGCAESASNIINEIYPDFPREIASTADLFKVLQTSPHFKGTLTPKEGCVVISPRTATKNGHVGFFVTDQTIVSNDSKLGAMMQNYNWDNWVRTFKDKRGLRIFLFEPK